jgi:hypothetical protein
MVDESVQNKVYLTINSPPSNLKDGVQKGYLKFKETFNHATRTSYYESVQWIHMSNIL